MKGNAKVTYDVRRSHGECWKCGKPCLMNMKTGKLYAACASCREKENRRARERFQAGLAKQANA